jgi:protein tyrosine/serine phosphatase
MEIEKYRRNDADEIIPGLWLGNFASSRDETFLKEKKIETVFNCTKDLPFSPIIRNRYRVPVDDNLQEEEIRNLHLWSYEVTYKLIQEMKKGKPVLVHCAAGMQRSAAVTAMYLIATHRMRPEQAKTYIQTKRPIAFRPGANFSRSIDGFYKSFNQEVLPQLEE